MSGSMASIYLDDESQKALADTFGPGKQFTSASAAVRHAIKNTFGGITTEAE